MNPALPRAERLVALLSVRRLRNFGCSFALALAPVFGAGAAHAEDTAASATPAEAPSRPALPPPEPRESWLVPSLHALGLMTLMRAGEAYLWPEPFAKVNRFGYHYREAFTRPPLWDGSKPLFEEDGDRYELNVFGHGLFGSELYLRVRACRKPVWQALLFTAAASTTWEYGFEASGVRPSALDLVFTPAAGLVLGEARFQVLKAARRLAPGAGRATLAAVVDPFGELERALGAPC